MKVEYVVRRDVKNQSSQWHDEAARGLGLLLVLSTPQEGRRRTKTIWKLIWALQAGRLNVESAI